MTITDKDRKDGSPTQRSQPAQAAPDTKFEAQFNAPSLSLPKGGGAIRGIDEKFQINTSNGTASLSVPLPFSPGRNHLTPTVKMSYNSGVGNGVMGIGWSLDFPSIQRKTDRKLPTYHDDEDVFIISGAEELAPFLRWESGEWKTEERTADSYSVKRYRPRIEGFFARIEKISHPLQGTYWRVTAPDNTTTFFGYHESSRIFDPADHQRIFQWLPEFTFDDKGNCLIYEYKEENLDAVPDAPHERNRKENIARYTNKHLKRIMHGNRTPYYIDPSHPYAPDPAGGGFLFETLFDYGEHAADKPEPAEVPGLVWESRPDAFSLYRSGFEIRTYRLVRRILFFHSFDELAGGNPVLVHSIDFGYQSSSSNSPQHTELTCLTSITECGYILKPDAAYSKKTLPPIEFTYEPLKWNDEVKEVDADSMMNLPVGLGNNYQWLDFYGEGISGVFTEQAEGWFYKSNLGDVDEDGKVRFDIAKNVVPKPSFSGMGSGLLQLQDLDADGQKQIVINTEGIRGFFELTEDNDWLPFRNFENFPNVDFRDPNLRMIDLNGDGRPDLLISEDNVFVWYPSLGKTGYGASNRAEKLLDEERGPSIVFSDALQTVYLSDMNGDGLVDVVRIRNGEVCYWPNLGYGRFGAKVNMSNAPVFDEPDQFNSAYLILADVSGTGATDILYLGNNKCSAYLNLSGNSWSAEQEIAPFPGAERSNKISAVDLLGNGTACLVWSSELPGNATAPMRYIDLMGGKKPHLITGCANNLGKETRLSFKSSTWFYLKDKSENRPWATKLPFPVHCVKEIDVIDRVTSARFVTEYSFHHGYYDHPEREFRGFGMVEQIDTEDYEHWAKGNAGAVVDRSLHQPPVLTKTWFHNGAFLESEDILAKFSREYWYEEMVRRGFPVAANEPVLDNPRLIAAEGIDPNAIGALTVDERREALRACKGIALRQEVFALDAPSAGATPAEIQRQLSPYTVSTHNCIIELLQPKAHEGHAVFVVKESEAITHHYERRVTDPRIAHTLNIKVDQFGNVIESASVVYGRKFEDGSLPDDIREKQRRILITFTNTGYTNDVENTVDYRIRVQSEAKTYEIKGLQKSGDLFKITDFDNLFAGSVEIPYHEVDSTPPPGTKHRRLIEHEKRFLFKDDLTGPLALHLLESRAINYESHKLAYTPGLLNDIFGAKVDDAVMSEGKFVHSEGDQDWWIRSGTIQYLKAGETLNDSRNRFYAPVSYTDAWGSVTTVKHFSTYFLLVEEILDAINNRTRVLTFNLRTLSPQRIIDPNDNLSEVLFDECGFVKALAVYGKGNEADDLSGISEYSTPAEDIAIADFLTAVLSTEITSLGKNLLKHSTMRFVYDAHRYRNSGGQLPSVAASVVREQHHADNSDSPMQIGFEYANGFRAVVMKKIQAEPGKARQVTIHPDNSYSVQEIDTSALLPRQLRWLGTGRTVLNNKGNPVKQYEPYFSATHRYEDLRELVESGVTPFLYYDPLSRLRKTDFPDGTFNETSFDAWKQTVSDRNDTVLDTRWYNNRINRLIDPELLAAGKDPVKEKEAAAKTAGHANTPLTQHFDTLARTILTIENNGKDAFNNDIVFLTRFDIDIEGNTRLVQDARGNEILSSKFDMMGNQHYRLSADAGERWMIQNISGDPLRTWDARNHEFTYEYDALRRPTVKRIKGGDGPGPLDHVVERLLYGEGMPNDALLNLRTRAVVLYDTAGKAESVEFDFKGNLLNSIRTFSLDYKHVVDWSGPNLDAELENEQHTTITRFDALNRIVQQNAPDGSILQPEYDEGNHLDRVLVTQKGKTETFVNGIDYNEKGQRSKITYGNGIITTYLYDRETFRLIRMRTRALNNDPLQDLSYTFDPAGNITHVDDKSIPVVFFNNQKIPGTASFTYDALYRLTGAAGREHAGQLAFGSEDNSNDAAYLKQYSQNDPMAWRTYAEQFRYDSAGNILQVRHVASNGNWTRDYQYAANSNRLLSTAVGSNTYNYTHHAQHGFVTSLPHLQVMNWNFRDELEAVAKQSLAAGTPETTYYVYDARGQRARKITERQAGPGEVPSKKSERIYLGGIEVHREYGNALKLERYTFHVMDDKRRIAMIETRTKGNDGSPKRLVRYVFSNHLASACLEADAEGRVISYEEFHPYGTTSYQAIDKNIKAASKRYRYNGMERDEESGLNYHVARYYAPWLGRWTAVDPEMQKYAPASPYCFSLNNPVKLFDPDGRDARLTVDPDNHTITYSTTVHFFGTAKEIKAMKPVAKKAEEFFAHPTIETESETESRLAKKGAVAGKPVFTDASGVQWTVKYDVHYEFHDIAKVKPATTYEDIKKDPDAFVTNFANIEKQLAKDIGFKPGDNIMIFAPPSGSTGGTTGLVSTQDAAFPTFDKPESRMVGQITRSKPFKPEVALEALVHETGHMLGFDERYEDFGGLSRSHRQFKYDFMTAASGRSTLTIHPAHIETSAQFGLGVAGSRILINQVVRGIQVESTGSGGAIEQFDKQGNVTQAYKTQQSTLATELIPYFSKSVYGFLPASLIPIDLSDYGPRAKLQYTPGIGYRVQTPF